MRGPPTWSRPALDTLPNQVVALNARGELGNVARTTLQGYSASEHSLVELIYAFMFYTKTQNRLSCVV